MTHSKSKLNTNEIPAFRKFLEARGFKCRDGKGDWQALQVQNITDRGWKAFCFNTKGVVTSPVEFDALIQVFRAPVDPVRVMTIGPFNDEKSELAKQHESDLLDDFAIAAMPSVIRAYNDIPGEPSQIMEAISVECYELAKAMMAERANHQPK